jgi:uncharacterized protein (DUF427 family)
VQYYPRQHPSIRLKSTVHSRNFAKMAPPTYSTFNKRIEATPRRVRVLFNKKIVADTAEAKYVWEHPYYPVYYLPAKDVQTKYIEKLEKSDDGDGHVCRLRVGNRYAKDVLWYENGELSGLIKFQFKEMGKLIPFNHVFLTWGR